MDRVATERVTRHLADGELRWYWETHSEHEADGREVASIVRAVDARSLDDLVGALHRTDSSGEYSTITFYGFAREVGAEAPAAISAAVAQFLAATGPLRGVVVQLGDENVAYVFLNRGSAAGACADLGMPSPEVWQDLPRPPYKRLRTARLEDMFRLRPNATHRG